MAPILVPATPMSLLSPTSNFTSSASSSASKMSNIANTDDAGVTDATTVTYAAFCNPPRRAKRHRSNSLMPTNNAVAPSTADIGVEDQMSFPPSSVSIPPVGAYKSSSTKISTSIEPQQQLFPSDSLPGNNADVNTSNTNADANANPSSATPNTGKRRGRKPGTLSRAARESQRKLNHSRIEKARRSKINDALAALRELVPSDYTSGGKRLINTINDIDGSDEDEDDDYASKTKPQKKEDKEREFKLEILERTVVFLRDMMARVEVLEKERKSLVRGNKSSEKGSTSGAECLTGAKDDMKEGLTICAKCASKKDVDISIDNGGGAIGKSIKRKRAEDEDEDGHEDSDVEESIEDELEEIKESDVGVVKGGCQFVGNENDKGEKEERLRSSIKNAKMGNVVGWEDVSESTIISASAKYSQSLSHTTMEIQESRPRRGRAYTQPEISLFSTESLGMGRNSHSGMGNNNSNIHQAPAISMRHSFSTSAVDNGSSDLCSGISPLIERQSSLSGAGAGATGVRRLPSITALLDETQFTVSPRGYSIYSSNVSPNLDVNCKNNNNTNANANVVQMLSPRTTPLTGPIQSSRFRSPPDTFSLNTAGGNNNNVLLPSPALRPTISSSSGHGSGMNYGGHAIPIQLPSPPNSARAQPIRHVQLPPALVLPLAAVRPYRSNSNSSGSEGGEERSGGVGNYDGVGDGDVRMGEADLNTAGGRSGKRTAVGVSHGGHCWTTEEESAASLLLVMGGNVGSGNSSTQQGPVANSIINAGDSSTLLNSSYARGRDREVQRRVNAKTNIDLLSLGSGNNINNNTQLPPLRSSITNPRDHDNNNVIQRGTNQSKTILAMTPTSLMESTPTVTGTLMASGDSRRGFDTNVYPPINNSSSSSNKVDAQTPASVLGINVHSRN